MLAAFSRNSKAATAVEYALLAPLFIALLFAVIQFGILYYTNSRLERSVFVAQKMLAVKAGRPESAAAVKGLICKNASLDCGQNGFFAEVVPLTATTPSPQPLAADGYSLTPKKTHILRAVYPWENPIPAAVLKLLGLEKLSRLDLQAAVFFYIEE